MSDRKPVSKLMIGFWALCLAIIVYMQLVADFGDRGMNNSFTMMALMLAAIVTLIWFTFFSGRPWKTRLSVLGGLLAFVLVFSWLFDFEGFRSEMVPIFTSRFAATELSAAVTGSGRTVDLVSVTHNDFPGFLGRQRNLRVDHVVLNTDWEANPPELLWKQEIGDGWGGFAVVNGYAATLEERDDTEMVTLYDAATGELIWKHEMGEGFFHFLGGRGPRSTPTLHDGVVYAMSAHGKLVAVDGATGEPLWERDLLADHGVTWEDEFARVAYGRPTSPLIVGDAVVVGVGGSADSPISVAGYALRTGDLLWQGGSRHVSMASPNLGTLAGRDQLLIVNENWVSGHDPADGSVLWEFEWLGTTSQDSNISNAVAVPPDKVFISKGYGSGAALYQLSSNSDGTFTPTALWANSRVLRTKQTNVVMKDGYVYGLSEGILECVDLATGERVWKAGRYHHGQILLVGDAVLLVLTEDGELLMVEASPDNSNNVLGQIQALNGHTWNNMALYGDVLLLRNGQEAAAYRLAADVATPEPPADPDMLDPDSNEVVGEEQVGG